MLFTAKSSGHGPDEALLYTQVRTCSRSFVRVRYQLSHSTKPRCRMPLRSSESSSNKASHSPHATPMVCDRQTNPVRRSMASVHLLRNRAVCQTASPARFRSLVMPRSLTASPAHQQGLLEPQLFLQDRLCLRARRTSARFLRSSAVRMAHPSSPPPWRIRHPTHLTLPNHPSAPWAPSGPINH